jgi:hypothetical protein
MALEMDPEIRARWTAALRSGKYQQGTAALHHGDEFCCLGVLCDLAVSAGVASATTPDEDGYPWAYDGRVDYLPESVTEWAGLKEGNPLVYGPNSPARDHLARLNDAYAWDFARIADAIDGGVS